MCVGFSVGSLGKTGDVLGILGTLAGTLQFHGIINDSNLYVVLNSVL